MIKSFYSVDLETNGHILSVESKIRDSSLRLKDGFKDLFLGV